MLVLSIFYLLFFTSQPNYGRSSPFSCQPSYPFIATSPISPQDSTGKNANYKPFVSLSVCLSTKAMRLELGTDLSTACLIAALNCFIAHRGKTAQILSDNGANFADCYNELKDIAKFLKLNESSTADSLEHNKIS